VLGPYQHKETAKFHIFYFLLLFTPLLFSYPSCRVPYAFLSCLPSTSYSSSILLLFPLSPLMLHLVSYSSLLVSSTSFFSSLFSLLFLNFCCTFFSCFYIQVLVSALFSTCPTPFFFTHLSPIHAKHLTHQPFLENCHLLSPLLTFKLDLLTTSLCLFTIRPHPIALNLLLQN
jgi:hypothetical protein